jgi:hypothetical protein
MQTQTKTKATIEAKKASMPAFFPDLLPPHRTRPQPRQDWSEFGDSKLNHNPVGSDLGYNFGQIRVYSDAKAVARPQSCPLASAAPRFCPFGGACHTCPAQVQAKLASDQPGDVFEQEADRVAGEVMKHAPGDPGLPKSPYAGKLSQVAPMIQRAAMEPTSEPPAAGPIGATAGTPVAAQSGPEAAVSGLILEDDVEAVHPGQMKKSEFLSQLRADICSAANAILAATGRTTDDCPYLNFWLNYYSAQSSRHLEQAIRRYAPETAGVTTASDYIALIVDRVSQAVTIWATTGEITGVPAGVSTAAPPAAGAGGAAATPAKTGGVQLKGRDGGGNGSGNLQAIQSQLGSGQPLDSGVKARMEGTFGHSFSQVRVHTDGKAAALSSSLNARAFTIGSDIAFAAGEYQPGTVIGDALVAHELAHVVQQGGTISSAAPLKEGGTEYGALEEEADQSAMGAVASLWCGTKGKLTNITRNVMPRLRSGLGLQRCNGDKKEGKKVEGKAEKKPAAPAAPACVHPVKPKSTQIAKDLDFGFQMKVEWESSTGKMDDLKGCYITEEITYSKIPNPPFGKADGNPLPESGKTQRIPALPGVNAEDGIAGDTHGHPRSLVRSPASADSYTVTQTYDYNSPACGGKWIPFANYVITYKIYKKDGGFRFSSSKTGTDGPFGSDEAI